MMRAIVTATVLAILIVPYGGAAANDSTASLDAGGLRLTYNPNISVVSEDLHLGLDEVRVAYRFRNNSDRDIETVVAFPLPMMHIGEEGNYALPESRDPINFIGFQVSVDGQRVEPKVEVKATQSGVDVSDVLKRHGVPLTMLGESDAATAALLDRLRDLPDAAKRELERYGVMDWNSSVGANNKPLASPHWETQITFYWMQTFPAKRTTEVTHRYHPVPRHFFFTTSDLTSAEMRKKYCFDASFIDAARAAFRRAAKGLEADSSPTLNGRELRYVLTTAQNWLGPIGTFRLTVQKPSRQALVSLCASGIRRTSATTFALSAANFSPDRDINLLFVELAAQN